MAELRPGWRRVKFGELVRQIKDRVDPERSGLERFVAGEHMDTDNLRIRRWGEIGGGYLGPAFHMRFRPGHVLYGSRRTYLRKVAVADFAGICANTTFVLESVDRTVLLPELLPFIMSTEEFHEHSRRESKGSVNPYINFSDLDWYEFALPPLEEQARIVTTLSHSATLLDSLRLAANEAKTVYQSALVALFVGQADAKGIGPEAWGHSHWPTPKLEKVSDPAAPISYGIVQPGDSVAGGVPTVSSNNLNIGFSTEIHYTAPAVEAAYGRSRVKPNDILITVKGFGTGNIAIVPEPFYGNITRDVARFRFLDPDDGVYFFHLWNCPMFERYWRAVSVGTTRPELSIANLRAMVVPWPARERRRELAYRLSEIATASERLSNRVGQALDAHHMLLRSVLSPGIIVASKRTEA